MLGKEHTVAMSPPNAAELAAALHAGALDTSPLLGCNLRLCALQQERAPANPLMAGLTVDTFFFCSFGAAMVLPPLDALVPKIKLVGTDLRQQHRGNTTQPLATLCRTRQEDYVPATLQRPVRTRTHQAA
jgi:hypothetical protein